MKKLAIFLGIFLLVIATARISYAENDREIKNQIREEKKKIIENLKENKKNLMEEVKTTIKSYLPKMINGTLTTMNGDTLTVNTKDSKAYTIYVSGNTLIKRRFGAASSLQEFSVGDELSILGTVHNTDNGQASQNEIDARYIRNKSIQRRFAVFNGQITSKSDGSFVITTKGRGSQTAYVSSSTIYKETGDKTITYADLKVGDKVLVKGELWDRANDKIDTKAVIRLPQKPTPTVTPVQTQ